MGSYIPSVLRGISAVQTIMAAAYESRTHTLNRFLIPRAQFAGDTAVTLTDGSYNTRTITNIPKYTTAQLANPSNTFRGPEFDLSNTFGNPVHPIEKQGKPLIIKVKRDPFTGEIGVKERRDPTDPTSPIVTKDYAVFNADGTYPGAPDTNPYDPNFDPWNYNDGTTNGARYRVNTATGEIYVNNTRNLIELRNPDGIVHIPEGANGTNGRDVLTNNVSTRRGTDMVVGIVQFDNLQGGAASAEQQRASELSGIIQSLTGIIRSLNDAKRSSLNIIR